MIYKLIAIAHYEIPEVKEYEGNEFLELSLDTLKEEINRLLVKYPEKKDEILKEAVATKSKIIQIYFDTLDSVKQKETKITVLETDIRSKAEKLKHYQAELAETNLRLEKVKTLLSGLPSYQNRIKQLRAKIELLKKIEIFLSNYCTNILPYLRNTYKDVMKDISSMTKGLYKRTNSLTINAPILYQYSREAIMGLISKTDAFPLGENSLGSLLNEEEKDFTWMALLYIERYPVIELTKQDATTAFTNAGLSKHEQFVAMNQMFGDKEEFFLDVWTLMKPIKDWPDNLKYFLSLFYNSLIIKDTIPSLINKVINKNLISTEDSQQIELVLQERMSLETSVLLRLNIHLLLTNLIEYLKKEKAQEQRDNACLENKLLQAKAMKIPIPEDLLKRSTEVKKETLDLFKNYYQKIIRLLEQYAQIVYKQAVNRYDEQVMPYLERIQLLVESSILEITELNNSQSETDKINEQKTELQQQVSGLNMVISSLTKELEQDTANRNILEQAIIKDTAKFDAQLYLVEKLINKIKDKIENPYSTLESTEINEEPLVEECKSIKINEIAVWQDLKEDTIYSATNETGVQLNFMFSKKIFKNELENELLIKFLKAMKTGLVGAKDTNGIKGMKERQTNYEIKVIGTAYRITGKMTLLNNQKIIVFDSWETH